MEISICGTTARHRFQHEAVRYALDNNLDLSLSIYSDIREWHDNMNEYHPSSEDVTSEENTLYRIQPLESDAYEWGNDFSVRIMSYINSWED